MALTDLTTLSHKFRSTIKIIRWMSRRLAAANKWGAKTLRASPKLFGNAMPKSGSHLLTQVLLGLVEIAPFANPGFPPVNRTEDNLPLNSNQIINNLLRMKSGEIRYGYISAKEPFLSLLTAPDRATIFIYRDPRDLLVSHVLYATEMNTDHGMHQYYTKVLATNDERLNAAIDGINEKGFHLPGVHDRYANNIMWLDQPGVLSIRFEDLILDREQTFMNILDYLEERGSRMTANRSSMIDNMDKAIQPKKSGTFRKGEPGNWKNHFTDGNIMRFKKATGDLLVSLGYEENNDW